VNQKLERLDGLAPFLQDPARELIARCERDLHRTLMVVSGWRSVQEQLLTYQKGRTLNRETGLWTITDQAQVVTRSTPGTSAHNVITTKGDRAAMALDVIPLLSDGTADWTVGLDFWDRLYELSWKCGLDPLGDLTGAYLKGDLGHFEEPAWRLKITGLSCLLPVGGAELL
jgi:hypothetical protein